MREKFLINQISLKLVFKWHYQIHWLVLVRQWLGDEHAISHNLEQCYFNWCSPGQNGHNISRRHVQMHFREWKILINISLKLISKGQINNIPASVQIMAWCRIGDKPLSEPMMTHSITHICCTRGRWVNSLTYVCISGRHVLTHYPLRYVDTI